MKALPFVLFLLLCACDNRDLENNVIPSKIVIRQYDAFGTGDPRISLRCSTEQVYPCQNYSISSTQSFDGSRLAITFTGIEEPVDCIPQPFWATTTVYLDDMPNGTYDLAINNALLKNEGKLTITDEVIVIDMVNYRGINVVNEVIRRTPKNTYFGWLSGGNAEAFYEALKKVEGVSKLNDQVPGVYSYYEIDADGALANQPDEFKQFIFQFTGDDNDLKEVMASYGEMSIEIETYKGEVITR